VTSNNNGEAENVATQQHDGATVELVFGLVSSSSHCCVLENGAAWSFGLEVEKMEAEGPPWMTKEQQ